MRMTLREVAALTGAALEGNPEHVIEGAAGLLEAQSSEVAFLENAKYAPHVLRSAAGAVFLPPASRAHPGGPANRLYCEQPRWAHAQVLQLIKQERWKPVPPIVSPKAEIHFEARLGKDVSVGPFTIINRRSIVGERTQIGAQVYIGMNARVGCDCVIHPQVVIGDYCEVGDRVILHPGTVLGSDGYGYWTDPKTGEHRKIQQVGRVVLENDVELGANVTIDRATTGETRVGAGTKIDNLVQLGHNVTLGRNCLLISQVGVAGSTRVGNQVILAGQAGIAGHLTIGDGAVVTAQTGVMSDVAPKSIVFGSPARPHREAMKLQAIFSKLPEIYEAFRQLKAKVSGKETLHAEG
ncbi:MAG: UDP-3-O-(3-hydroxymyristoyl)glucosamine N-acyltransferase [Elusimicrobia bacterium GWA2_69_24]|nr:MAG: UDP-3-O-(3-hydroxymyristoyl)glucosamine N-acyltransferase [Elusimicrobia bacterium GWA2_69_24]HBL18973.1 UDP-3-O-(3-hydroxymyristoyl)glucosamine N-acyltransferase [Elusimicrobiota bacterium]